MNSNAPKIPYKISEYITENFKEDFLFEVKEIIQIKGHNYFSIEVSKDDIIHKLKFDEIGNFIKEEVDQAFPPDIHEDLISKDLPE
jgi:hypothetical protein